jgi:NAD(P)-dependent dehydrogenase (short-subunit alcohol dehydrogenase family)
MASLDGNVAVVTGASRGLGKGIALGLGEAGATVYVTGRSTLQRAGELPGTIDETADEVSRLGGRGVAVSCDHRDDDQVEALFKRVGSDEGRLDVLINNAMASPPQSVLWGGQRFWEMPIALWDDLIDVGLRSHFVASRFAAPLLIEQGHGTIINVASHGSVNGKSSSMPDALISYSVGKAGLHRLTSDMAAELRDTGVAVIAVWPPGSRTEGVLAEPELFGDLSRWREPIFTGRVIAAFLATRGALELTGQALVITDLASELGVSP